MAQDAVEASPETTKKLFENEDIRVLEISIKPGEKEPLHIHKWKGIMIITSPAKLRYYDDKGNVELEATRDSTEWREIEKPHAVENIDTQPFKAYRIETKK